jgi:hypothetical protein
MRRELLDRLEKLEQRQQNKYVPPPPIPLSMFLIAYFDGGWQPGESAADAYNRSLNCQWAAELVALTAEQVRERHNAALERIFRKRKIDPQALEPWPKVEKMLKRLYKSGLPVPAASWTG